MHNLTASLILIHNLIKAGNGFNNKITVYSEGNTRYKPSYNTISYVKDGHDRYFH